MSTRYHRKNIFLTLIAIIILIIFILSMTMYNYFKNTSLIAANNYIKDSLLQVSTAARTMDTLGHSLSLQLMNERDIIPILSPNAPSANQLSIALKRLDTYSIMNSQIHSLYLYNGYTDTFYTNLPSEGLQSQKTFFDQDIVSILKNLKNHDTSLPLPRSIPNHTSTFASAETSNVYTFVRYTTTIYNNKEIVNAVIINLSEESLQELVSSMSNNKPHIFIINKEGILISSMGQYPMLSNLSTHPVIEPVIYSNEDSGYFLHTIKDIPSIVTYICSPSLDNWYFIQITPYEQITKDIVKLRNYTLIAGIALLFVGGLYTLIASKKLSSPIYKLEDSIDYLKRQTRENTSELRYHFLNSLLSSPELIERYTLEEKFETYKINLDPYMPYKAALLEVKLRSTPPVISPDTDALLLTSSIINIAEEIGNESFNCTCIPVSDLKIVCLLNINTNTAPEDIHLQLETYLYTLIERCEKLLNISLAPTVSMLGEDLALLPSIYQDLIDSSLYHLVYQNDSPIFQEFIEQIEQVPFTYPQELHQFLFDNLKLGNLQEVTTIYRQIIDYTCNYSYTAFMSTLLHLTYSIHMMISKLNREESLMIQYNQNRFVSFVKNAESLTAINESFISLFEQICSEIDSSREQRKEKNYDNLIQEIYRLIDTGYTNPDTCIQSISDQVNISAAYLGRLFTKLTNESITQCISNKRLEAACHLLTFTEEPIAQISESCGFSSINYFYKVFKKAYGLTPSNYRKMEVPK